MPTHKIKGQKPYEYKPSKTWKPKLSPIKNTNNSNFKFPTVLYVSPKMPIFGVLYKGRFRVINLKNK